jgi:hypothetical protein
VPKRDVGGLERWLRGLPSAFVMGFLALASLPQTLAYLPYCPFMSITGLESLRHFIYELGRRLNTVSERCKMQSWSLIALIAGHNTSR